MNNKNILFLLLIGIFLLVFRIQNDSKTDFPKETNLNSNTPIEQKQLNLPETTNGSDIYELTLNSGTILNGKTKAEIYEIRKHYVSKSLFANKQYRPSEEIFGQIEDGKPWWHEYICDIGINTSEGISRVSRYINNPNLLVAVMAPYRDFDTDENRRYCHSELSKTIPYSLTYNKSNNQIIAKYKIEHEFLNERINFDGRTNSPRILELVGMNAKDFGYRYVHVNSLSNAKMFYPSDSAFEFRDYIHVGGSCGIEGGCNNISPYQQEKTFYLTDLPAELNLYLWNKEPASVNSKPDMKYKIVFYEN